MGVEHRGRSTNSRGEIPPRLLGERLVSTRLRLYSSLTHCIVPSAEAQGTPNDWVVFNDFSVRNISEDDALSFSAAWKVRVSPYFVPIFNSPDPRNSVFGTSRQQKRA